MFIESRTTTATVCLSTCCPYGAPPDNSMTQAHHNPGHLVLQDCCALAGIFARVDYVPDQNWVRLYVKAVETAIREESGGSGAAADVVLEPQQLQDLTAALALWVPRLAKSVNSMLPSFSDQDLIVGPELGRVITDSVYAAAVGGSSGAGDGCGRAAVSSVGLLIGSVCKISKAQVGSRVGS
jgi:hypothetical protein